MEPTDAGPDPYLSHWSDLAAAKTLAAHPDKDVITVAAGITPSGVVHIGNFREVITVDLVARALRDRGAKVRFIYSWDDFDVLRKVPENMPQPEMLRANLRRSISAVPDPYGEHDSYATHNIAAFERSLAPLGVEPEFIRQSQRYRAGAYAEGIRRALAQAADIRAILNGVRDKTTANTRLEDDWLPISGFCDACGRDTLEFAAGGEWTVRYTCSTCNHAAEVDLRSGGNLKLPWRIDWPMRWAFEGVCFEPGGKDHSTAGGSYDTGKEIVRTVYGWRAPEYVGYDFVRIKGRAGKISSSKGEVVTVEDCLEVYEPELLRYLFVSYRPNTEFQISFDLDVIKLYEDYDRARRIAYGLEPVKDDKQRTLAQRTLQLASVDHRRIHPGDAMPFIPSFRNLGVTLQIFEGDLDKTVHYFEATGQIKTDEERRLARQRAVCAWNWIRDFAPDEFRYQLRKAPVVRGLEPAQATCLRRLVAALEGVSDGDFGSEDKLPNMSNLWKDTGLDNKTFLPVLYDLLIDRDRGPKLTTLLTVIGKQRALNLLSPSLAPLAG